MPKGALPHAVCHHRADLFIESILLIVYAHKKERLLKIYWDRPQHRDHCDDRHQFDTRLTPALKLPDYVERLSF